MRERRGPENGRYSATTTGFKAQIRRGSSSHSTTSAGRMAPMATTFSLITPRDCQGNPPPPSTEDEGSRESRREHACRVYAAKGRGRRMVLDGSLLLKSRLSTCAHRRRGVMSLQDSACASQETHGHQSSACQIFLYGFQFRYYAELPTANYPPRCRPSGHAPVVRLVHAAR